MELMAGGCLTDILDQFDTVRLTEGQAAFICLQVNLQIMKTKKKKKAN